MKTRIKSIFKSFGPGFIIASAVLGPGSITVASRIGSEYSYTFLWVIVIAAVSMIVYTSMGARYGTLHKKSLLTKISDVYGRWFAILIGIASFIAASSFQFGNNLGIGIGMKGLTGLDERIWPLIFTPAGMALVFWSKNLYKIIEKLMMGLVMIMILAFGINLLITQPEIVPMAKGFIPSSFSGSDFAVIAALTATTFSLNGAIYQSYLVQNKGWKKENLKTGLNDTYMGIFILSLISVLIIITSAAALHPKGIHVESAADMAIQLEALFGSGAKLIFSIGLCAAAFSSLMVNAVIGGGLLSDSLGLGKSMDEKIPRLFTICILFLGMMVAVFFKGNVVYALIIAQASSILGVPLIALGLSLLLNHKKTMGNYKNTSLQNILALIGFLLICIMVVFMIGKLGSFINI